MNYRAEIDGLRAVAVMSVLFYHANFYVAGHHVFSGGFIGVDIFFVISGYLITFILLREIQDQKFSIVKFYERRARRILPALITVASVTTIIAYYVLMPSAFKEYAGSLAATLVFVSNIFFWNQDSYTAEASDFKPFLHTWSLGVEEQFYIFFPFMLLFTWVLLRQHIIWLMVFGALASLILAEWASRFYPDASFYLLPTRGWELLAGSILAWLDFKGYEAEKEGLKRVLPFLGCTVLGGGVLLMNVRMLHPGIITVLPIIGTMFIIRYAGGRDPISWLLKLPPVVWIGLISYSLYLWHQPIFAFSRIMAIEEPSSFQKLGWIVLSMVLAGITYWVIEKPTRNRKLVSVKVIWCISALGTFGFLGIGLYAYQAEGLPNRFPGVFQKAVQAETNYGAMISDGDVNCRNFYAGQEHCSFEYGKAEDTIITIGDSHVRPLTKPFMDILAKENARFVPLVAGGCMFSLGIDMPKNGDVPCDQAYNTQRFKVMESYANTAIVFVSRLQSHLHYEPFDNQEGGIVTKSWKRNVSKEEYRKYAVELAEKTIQTIQSLLDNNHRVVLVYPVPEVGWNVPRRFVKIAPRDETKLNEWLEAHPFSTSYDVFLERNKTAYETYDSVPDHPNLIRIYPESLLCNTVAKGRCITMDGDNFYYRDDNHLSYDGATMLVQNILMEMKQQWDTP